MMGESFTCARCVGIFQKARSDEEAMAEFEATFFQAGNGQRPSYRMR